MGTKEIKPNTISKYRATTAVKKLKKISDEIEALHLELADSLYEMIKEGCKTK
ncbi:hypothetical protein V5T82_14120 [Magnetovibrio sp. PR-2]|uniref:hypothetical protein n=1 Tax=Magnetovibrio sp. PR-2 TaxID=3120356 RepID=UPI002FCE0912